MPTVADVIKDLIEKKGGNKAKIARELGSNVTGQILGQYVAGRQKPKSEFKMLWKKVYGEDIDSLIEGNVSHETNPSKDKELEKSYLDHIASLKEENRDLRQILLNLTSQPRSSQKA